MKYTKKVPYFKKGDIIDKAARNLPEEQREAILKISSAQAEQEIKDRLNSVGAGFRMPTARVVGPVDTRSAQIENTVGQKAARTRGEAFQAARKRGDKEFLWKGKRYHTRTAEEEAERRANDGWVSPDWDGTLIPAEEVARQRRLEAAEAEEAVSVANVNTPAPTRTEDNSGNWFQRGLLPSLWDWMKYHNTVQQNSVRNAQDRATVINAQKKEDKAERKAAAEAARKKYWEDNNITFRRRGGWLFQQGGNINKFQRGSSIKNTDYSAGWEERERKRKRREEYRAWKNSDAATQRLNTLFDNTKRPLRVSTSNTDTGETVKIRPHWIDRFTRNSNVMMRHVSPNLRDTTYAVDDGVRRYANYQDGSYRETMPIIGPGRYTGSTPPTREALQNQFEQYYKKEGGTINKSQQRGGWLFQQGGQMPQGDKLHLRNIWERMFGITPAYTPVNSQESITSYMDNTHKGPVEKRVIRKEVPYADLHSTMSIRNPGTNRADTTFTAPSGTKYDMNDVRSGKAPSGYSYKFFRKPAGYFQQGGQMPQEGSQEELVLDFAVRYLVTMGVPEEDIMDPQGNLNPEHQQELEQVFNSQEIDWSDYAASPDEYMQQFIGNLQAQTQMARKGAKLKRLSQLRIYKK